MTVVKDRSKSEYAPSSYRNFNEEISLNAECFVLDISWSDCNGLSLDRYNYKQCLIMLSLSFCHNCHRNIASFRCIENRNILFHCFFSGVASWMQTGERQTARLRVKYIESILKKDISFFDTEARDANILFHISSDAILVQDAIGDKVTSPKQSHC